MLVRVGYIYRDVQISKKLFEKRKGGKRDVKPGTSLGRKRGTKILTVVKTKQLKTRSVFRQKKHSRESYVVASASRSQTGSAAK